MEEGRKEGKEGRQEGKKEGIKRKERDGGGRKKKEMNMEVKDKDRKKEGNSGESKVIDIFRTEKRLLISTKRFLQMTTVHIDLPRECEVV